MIKPPSILVVVLFALAGLDSIAQPATNTAARPQRPPPLRSPEISADRQVTFRMRAAKATEVVVAGQWPDGRAPLTKGDNDVWSVTVGPVAPGVWEYSFQVDGLSMIDPANPAIKPMREPRTSILHLPGDPPAAHDFQDVPHGVVRQHTYRSKSLDRLRELVVYTPPGYEKSRTRFPTLYLQHGNGDNQATWTTHGKAHWILDNLIAQGRAKPMLIVMMDGHAAPPGDPTNRFTNNTVAFEHDLLADVIPFVEANYRVKTTAAGRALAGLSMGGGQALTVGLNHADSFAWVGGFSSGVPASETVAAALEAKAGLNRKLKLLWIACGKDDFLLQRNEEFIARLREKNVKHQWELTPGNHSWPVWRTYLAEFAPKLF